MQQQLFQKMYPLALIASAPFAKDTTEFSEEVH